MVFYYYRYFFRRIKLREKFSFSSSFYGRKKVFYMYILYWRAYA